MYMTLTNNGTLIITNKFFVPRSSYISPCLLKPTYVPLNVHVSAYLNPWPSKKMTRLYIYIVHILFIHRLGGPYWEKLCQRSKVPVLKNSGTVSPNTDRPRPVSDMFIFFLLRFKSFTKIFLHFPTYVCWSRTRSFVLLKGAINCKPKQNITTWFLARQYILWHLLLSFRIYKGFCVLLDNS